MNETIRAALLYLRELEDFRDTVSTDDACSLLHLAREGRRQAEQIFRVSMYAWRLSARVALKRARSSAMETGDWSRWLWLTWIGFTIPFRYHWLLLMVSLGCSPHPTLLLAVKTTGGLADPASGKMHR